MPVQLKAALVMCRGLAAGAVARPGGLDVGGDFCPRLDVESGVDQGLGCFGHSMAGRSNRDDELPPSCARRSFFVGGQKWRVGWPVSGPTSLPSAAAASNFSTLRDLGRGPPRAFGIT